MSQLWFWPFWVMFLKLWLKVVHIHQRQNMNWPLADNFKATSVTFLPKKLASNVQSSCIDKSKWPKSELWHYCIKATNCKFVCALRRLSSLNAFKKFQSTWQEIFRKRFYFSSITKCFHYTTFQISLSHIPIPGIFP